MQDSAKYLIHADIEADGVVERSDVVGAIFGQTEGLLGDELDIRGLQESGKLGRIEVEIASEGGQSRGSLTIASGLDRVETAILAAALESIDRVGPCRAELEVTDLEDARSAKRRDVVERATELLAEFDEAALSSSDLVDRVRQAVRVADIEEFHGFPAGPRVTDSDAVVVVEGRSDVLTLLRYGVKNAIAVEGTDVPDAVADLTRDRTVTAFLDGDRGGDLILRELAQVGEIDYVALAPPGRSVEDLSRGEVMTALREKVPFEAEESGETLAATDGSARPMPDEGGGIESPAAPGPPGDAGVEPEGVENGDGQQGDDTASGPESTETGTSGDAGSTDEDESADVTTGQKPRTLAGHVEATIAGETGLARALDADWSVVAERPAGEAFDLLAELDAVPVALVVDGESSQRLLDVAAQRGVDQIVCESEGEYVKQPTDVRVRTAAQL